MLSRLALFCALILLAACGQAHERVTVGRAPMAPASPARPTAPATEYEGLPPLESVELWHATVRWNAVLAFNAELARQKAAAERASEAAQARVPRSNPPRVTPPQSGTRQSGACGGWHDLIASLWPASQVGTACRIMMCESGGNPNAYNKSGAIGLFQLLGHGGTTDPVQNATVAHRLWQSQGWSPWVCR